MGRRLWSDEAGRSLFAADDPLAEHGPGRGLAGTVAGMSQVASIFHIVGPGDRG